MFYLKKEAGGRHWGEWETQHRNGKRKFFLMDKINQKYGRNEGTEVNFCGPWAIKVKVRQWQEGDGKWYQKARRVQSGDKRQGGDGKW